MTESELKELLDEAAMRINVAGFIEHDPVEFPHRFDTLPDIEIVALLSATIAWGNRRMIRANCEKMLRLMEYRPLEYVMDEGYEDLVPAMNIHRTFFALHFQQFLRGLRRVYQRYGTLEGYAAALHIGEREDAPWALVEGLNRELAEANGGVPASRCLPLNLKTTALKRVNMALRWLVRDDGIVDLGVWKVLRPSQLFVPLDVHVGNTARQLGLITRRANDRRAVIELMEPLRRMRPDDPTFYDFALFGLSVNS